jgi:diguanylate cyclase (GGDEF)-like protein
MDQGTPIVLNKKILLLCIVTFLISLGIVSGGLYWMGRMQRNEKAQMVDQSNLAVDAFEQYTIQIVNYVDALLHAVRMVYLNTHSVIETKQFIDGLSFDKSIVDNIYLISTDGVVIIAHDEQAKYREVRDREYFKYHQSVPADRLFLSAVETGRITSKYHFRITRRINNPDNSFGGIVLATVNPQSFVRYYQQLRIGSQNVASLVGIDDKKLRARIPEPDPDKWGLPIESPLWRALEAAEIGIYETQSFFDNIHRTYAYRKVSNLPLVMVVGFSEDDLKDRITGSIHWLVFIETIVIIFILIIAIAVIRVLVSHEKLKAAHQNLNDLYLKIRDLALFDALTGLPSRTLFSDRFQQALQTAERNSDSCALMYIDLDGFKQVNDRHGHEVGDHVLKVVSSRMAKMVRSADTVCRWGGDEFLILLPQSGSACEVVEIAERLLALSREPIHFRNNACQVSASIGIAIFPVHGQNPEMLQNAADAAMYLAKKQGKCRVVLAPSASGVQEEKHSSQVD